MTYANSVILNGLGTKPTWRRTTSEGSRLRKLREMLHWWYVLSSMRVFRRLLVGQGRWRLDPFSMTGQRLAVYGFTRAERPNSGATNGRQRPLPFDYAPQITRGVDKQRRIPPFDLVQDVLMMLQCD